MRTAYSESGRHQRRPTALVTGATSGIGLAVTRDLATDHDLILLARTATDLDELASVLGEDSGAGVRTCAVDLTDDEALAAAIGELDLADLDVLDLDLVSVAHLTGLLLPALRQARGLVVMINSGAGLRARPGQALYCAAKAGLRALTDVLREEERGRVRVTTVYPGRVDTPMQRRAHRERSRRLHAEGSKARHYRAADHMTTTSVASTVRLAVNMPVDAVVEDLSVRPADML